MEDLFESHLQPEQNVTPSEDLMSLSVEALAKSHAFWWSDPRVGTEVGRLFDSEMLIDFVEKLETSVSEFFGHSGVLLTEEQKNAYELMLANADRIWGRLMDREGLTVTHGDCHWWNFLYPRDLSSDSVRIFDWHLWHVDLGARDLAFLLALGGFAEPKPEVENSLLRRYHSTLLSNGILDYSFEQLFDEYRRSAVRNLNIPVIFWSQGKHASTCNTALRRATEAFERLRCSDLFA
jgi:hypothetical protein